MMSNICFPYFVVVGAMKSGTTSLHTYLSSHPELSVPFTRQELNFFNAHWEAGKDWYESNFDNNTHLKRGEINPNYSMSRRLKKSLVPERMYAFCPDVKIIYIVRDPIERFISHVHHNLIGGRENRSIEEIVLDEKYKFGYISYGEYYFQIEKYLEFFKKDQILIISNDDLRSSVKITMSKIFKFLDVDANFYSSKFKIQENRTTERVKPNRMFKYIKQSKLISLYRKNIKELLPRQLHVSLIRNFGGESIPKPILNEFQQAYLRSKFSDGMKNFNDVYDLSKNQWKI